MSSPFWTLHGSRRDITYCEAHALDSTNAGALQAGWDEFESMEQFRDLIQLMSPEGAQPVVEPHEEGPCERCQAEALAKSLGALGFTGVE